MELKKGSKDGMKNESNL